MILFLIVCSKLLFFFIFSDTQRSSWWFPDSSGFTTKTGWRQSGWKIYSNSSWRISHNESDESGIVWMYDWRWFFLSRYYLWFNLSLVRYLCLLYFMFVIKAYFVRHDVCLKDVFCTLWRSQRRLLYVMFVLKAYFVRHDVRLKGVFCTSCMSKRRLLCVMDVLKTSFVRYGCLNDVFFTWCMS